jgi:hypothetical protein
VVALSVVLCFLAFVVFALDEKSPLRPSPTQNIFTFRAKDSPIFIFTTIESIGDTPFTEKVAIHIPSASLSNELIGNAEKACVDRVEINAYVYQNGSMNGEERRIYGSQLGKDGLCIQSSPTDTTTTGSRVYSNSAPLNWDANIMTGTPMNFSYYKYPYDDFRINISVTFFFIAYDKTGNKIDEFSIPAQQQVHLNLSGWEASREVENSWDSDVAKIAFVRPSNIRVLAPLLLFFVLIFTTAIPFVDSFSTAAEIVIGLFLGIWSIRLILIPNVPPGITALDIIILGEYLAIGIALSIHPINYIITSQRKRKRDLQIRNSSTSEQESIQNNSSKPSQYASLANSLVFHKFECVHLQKSHAEMFVVFESENEAILEGKRPCRNCIGIIKA